MFNNHPSHPQDLILSYHILLGFLGLKYFLTWLRTLLSYSLMTSQLSVIHSKIVWNISPIFVKCNLVLNWKKFNIIVKEGMVLGHKIWKRGIKVEKSNIKVFKIFLYQLWRVFITFRSVWASMGDLSRTSKKLPILCVSYYRKKVKFVFDDACVKAFEFLKDKLILFPIIMSFDWSISFKVMCDASGMALRVVLDQRREKILHSICYDSK